MNVAKWAGGFFNSARRVLRDTPGLNRLSSITPDSPLDLFDVEQYRKYVKEKNIDSTFWEGRKVQLGAGGAIKNITDPDLATALTRKIGLGAVGGGLLLNTLGIDPMGASSMVSDAAWGIGHGVVGASLYGMGGKSRLLGLAYMGKGLYNMTQPGDQVGPF